MFDEIENEKEPLKEERKIFDEDNTAIFLVIFVLFPFVTLSLIACTSSIKAPKPDISKKP